MLNDICLNQELISLKDVFLIEQAEQHKVGTNYRMK
jgi:hypothetical protein